MFGMGFGEMLVILILAVVFLGPEKIPETARSLGKWFYELKSSMDDIKKSFETDARETTKPSKPNTVPQDLQATEINTDTPKKSWVDEIKKSFEAGIREAAKPSKPNTAPEILQVTESNIDAHNDTKKS